MKFLWRLRIFLRPYWGQVLLTLLMLLATTATRLVVPEIIRQVIDIGLLEGELPLLVNSALIILGVGLARAVLSYGQRFISNWISFRVSYDFRNRLYEHIQRLPFTYHDHHQTGQLISRCIEDVRSIQRFTSFGVVELVQTSLLLVGVTALLFLNSPRLAVIAVIPMIPLIWATTSFGTRVGNLFLAVDNALGELSTRVQENVMGVQVIRAFSREPYEIHRFEKKNRALFTARLTVIREWARVMPSSHFLIALSTILIFWFGGGMVLRGEMTLGEIVAFNGYLLLMAEPARQLIWLVNTAGEATAGVERIFDVLDHEPRIRSPEDAIALPLLSGGVVFQDVALRYEGETSHALCEINLTVEPNQIVALIGPTGSGKTTLVNLIPRFYDVTSGGVFVDGHDIRVVELVTLRRQIGIVLQTSLLFSDTIRENIAYGRPDATKDEIIAVAKAAQAHEFIVSMPDGYDTEVGERGVTLSGGQRQRIAIARALLLDPRILILDDSTSSVDTQTEHLIQKALDLLMKGRTTFVIAQRFSTVRQADLILVMDDGRIVEQGTHEDLLAQGGLYKEIFDLQIRGDSSPVGSQGE